MTEVNQKRYRPHHLKRMSPTKPKAQSRHRNPPPTTVVSQSQLRLTSPALETLPAKDSNMQLLAVSTSPQSVIRRHQHVSIALQQPNPTPSSAWSDPVIPKQEKVHRPATPYCLSDPRHPNGKSRFRVVHLGRWKY